MPYIGNTVQNQGFTPAIDYFSGNGVTVTFTLSRPVVGVAQMIVAVDNVIQNPSTAFTVSGSSITFTSAPLSGTNNIWVEYTSLITTYNAISQDPSVIGDITASGGFLSTGDFGNTYTDGTIVDYVTGAARITTGPLDDMVFYHGGTASRSEMMRLSYTGKMLVGQASSTNSSTLQVTNVATDYSGWETGLQLSAPNYPALRLMSTTPNKGVLLATNADGSYNVLVNATSTSTGIAGMGINASGYVTMPYQPAFKASATTSVGTSNAVLPFNTTTSSYGGFNRGGFFNTSTYRFTAPVAGVYQFSMTLSVYNTGSGSYPFIRINGTQCIGVDGFPSGGVWVGKTICICLSLAVNDYVDCYWEGTATYSIESGPWASFSGYLIG